jgi:two-component system response regulator TctD
MNVFVVISSNDSLEHILNSLTASGYTCRYVDTPDDIWVTLIQAQYVAAILDLDLIPPECLASIRRSYPKLPILSLFSGYSDNSCVTALTMGSDDCMQKPIRIPELKARLMALIRRANHTWRESPTNVSATLQLDSYERCAYYHGKPIPLSRKETELLQAFLISDGSSISKQQLLTHIYQTDDAVTLNAIEVIIHRLRKKLASKGISLRTIRGIGYRLDIEEGPLLPVPAYPVSSVMKESPEPLYTLSGKP